MPDSFILFMFAAKDRFVRKAGDRLLKEKYWEDRTCRPF
jgi:hypothetical protein